MSDKFPNSEELEAAYREVAFGHDEPDVMCMNGKTLKEFAAMNGHPVENDVDGNPIIDGEVYCLTNKGIYRWRE